MAFPFLLAAGFVVTASATAVAWIYDCLTEDERRQQDGLKAERADLQEQLRRAESSGREQVAAESRRAAESMRTRILRMLRDKEASQSAVEEELEQLWGALHAELLQENANPWRRRTLLQRSTQIEDARARAHAHRAYRRWYRAKLDALWQEERHAELIAFDSPALTVPAEWLYVGKVVCLAPGELGRPLSFGHQLRLQTVWQQGRWTTAPQELLMLGYPDQEGIPVQVVAERERGTFLGCVGRGMLHADHVVQAAPADFQVHRWVDQRYVGTLMGGTVDAVLKPEHIPVRGLRLLPGEVVNVWPDLYDLCMQSVPGTQSTSGRREPRTQIQVTARAPAGSDAQRQLALAVNDQIEHCDLLEQAAPDRWRLESFSEKDDSLVLLGDQLRLHCRMDRQRGLLVAQRVEPAEIGIDGLLVPLYIEPVDSRLANEPLVQWPAGLQLLHAFALQSESDPERQRARQRQLQFMERWQRVVDYQVQQEMLHTVSLQAEAELTEDDDLVLRVAAPAGEGPVVGWLEAWREELRSGGRSPNVKLDVWLEEEAQPGAWVEVLRGGRASRGRGVETTEGAGFLVRFRARKALRQWCAAGARRYRLTLERLRPDLARQRKALRDFAEDRIVEPVLKEALLAPAHHKAFVDPEWQARIEAGLEWANPKLTPTQRGVIETCLRNAHLAVVQGPPGTAKTTCIVEILHQVFAARPATRVLLVSQQNAAVDNALKRFLESSGPQPAVSLLRIGSKVENMAEALRPYSLDATIARRMGQWRETAERQRVRSHQDGVRQAAGQWLALLKQYQPDLDNPQGPRTPEGEFAVVLLQGHHLVGATCVGLATTHMGLDQLQFDLAIIDEAGRATVPELLIPMLRSRKAILIGDHFQLPPAVAPVLREERSLEDLPFLSRDFLETSFFETLFDQLPADCRARLCEQYRMAAPIGDLVAELFYSPGGQRTLFNGQRDPAEQDKPVLYLPLCWIDVHGSQEPLGTSQINRAEVEAITRFLLGIADRPGAGKAKDVAVITPYGAQKRELIAALRNAAGHVEDTGEFALGGLRIRVDTVDSFQGSEADLVCYSTVRTHGSLRFILDEKRLNVACSRAKESIVFFGDAEFLASKHSRLGRRNYFAEIVKRLEAQDLMVRTEHRPPAPRHNARRPRPPRPQGHDRAALRRP